MNVDCARNIKFRVSMGGQAAAYRKVIYITPVLAPTVCGSQKSRQYHTLLSVK